MPSFKFLLEKLAWIFTIYIVGFYVSALFGGPLPFFKMILSIVFIVGGYWVGFALLAPFFERIFKKLNWNWNFGIALFALIWLWAFAGIYGILYNSELGQWLTDPR